MSEREVSPGDLYVYRCGKDTYVRLVFRVESGRALFLRQPVGRRGCTREDLWGCTREDLETVADYLRDGTWARVS